MTIYKCSCSFVLLFGFRASLLWMLIFLNINFSMLNIKFIYKPNFYFTFVKIDLLVLNLIIHWFYL